jgi:hypothetical protein
MDRSETIHQLSPGVWHITGTGYSKIAEENDNYDFSNYAKAANALDLLSTFIEASHRKYFGETFVINDDGSMTWSLPCSNDRAKDIVRFLTLPMLEKKKMIREHQQKFNHLDSDGRVLDYWGRTVYSSCTPESVAEQIKEKEREIEHLKAVLGERLMENFKKEK